MNEMGHSKTTRKQAKSAKIDWSRFDAMTDAQRHQAALNDPDAQPLSEEDLARMKRRAPKALRQRIGKLREEEPEAEEIAAIEQGRGEFGKGNFVDLSGLHDELGRRRRQPRAKKSQTRSRR